MKETYDVIIVGTGVSGCFAAIQFPKDKRILMITKKTITESDSYIAQGGICTLKDEGDYDAFFQDTLKAGHYENNKDAVHIMISDSQDIIKKLKAYGVRFETHNGELAYTMEGAHSTPRILYHKDVTGEEITQKLINVIRGRDNIKVMENTLLIDLLIEEDVCDGILVKDSHGECEELYSNNVILATGGIGGLFDSSTNYEHLTGDALVIAKEHGIKLKDENYVQIHPTTLYSKKKGRRFLISESVRGEGGVLYNKDGERFVDELLPRDLLAEEIYRQMCKDQTPYVWLSMKEIKKDIKKRFPNIYKKCLEEGYDLEKDFIPVVPAQHYYMGGIETDLQGRTSMKGLYAVGETSCNGVHGANRLASNSLLESLVFAKRAAEDILTKGSGNKFIERKEKTRDIEKIEEVFKERKSYQVKDYLGKGGNTVG